MFLHFIMFDGNPLTVSGLHIVSIRPSANRGNCLLLTTDGTEYEIQNEYAVHKETLKRVSHG